MVGSSVTGRVCVVDSMPQLEISFITPYPAIVDGVCVMCSAAYDSLRIVPGCLPLYLPFQ
jgi:hypothetical protein